MQLKEPELVSRTAVADFAISAASTDAGNDRLKPLDEREAERGRVRLRTSVRSTSVRTYIRTV